jgi:hypothetical protein
VPTSTKGTITSSKTRDIGWCRIHHVAIFTATVCEASGIAIQNPCRVHDKASCLYLEGHQQGHVVAYQASSMLNICHHRKQRCGAGVRAASPRQANIINVADGAFADAATKGYPQRPAQPAAAQNLFDDSNTKKTEVSIGDADMKNGVFEMPPLVLLAACHRGTVTMQYTTLFFSKTLNSNSFDASKQTKIWGKGKDQGTLQFALHPEYRAAVGVYKIICMACQCV